MRQLHVPTIILTTRSCDRQESSASGDPLNYKLLTRVRTYLLTFLWNKSMWPTPYAPSHIFGSNIPNISICKGVYPSAEEQSGKTRLYQNEILDVDYLLKICRDLPFALLPFQIITTAFLIISHLAELIMIIGRVLK